MTIRMGFGKVHSVLEQLYSIIPHKLSLKRPIYRLSILSFQHTFGSHLDFFPLCDSAGWRDVDGRAPRQRGQKEALDQLLGQIKDAHRHCVCHGTNNLSINFRERVHLTY